MMPGFGHLTPNLTSPEFPPRSGGSSFREEQGRRLARSISCPNTHRSSGSGPPKSPIPSLSETAAPVDLWVRQANCGIDLVKIVLANIIKALQLYYTIPDPLPWAAIATPLARAEDSLARLDQQLAKSPIREGWIARTHFTDAAASLWLEGELVHLEDLVLHDARMDVRTPTYELIRAHTVVRARRRIAGSKPDQVLSPSGLAGLRSPAPEINRIKEGSN